MKILKYIRVKLPNNNIITIQPDLFKNSTKDLLNQIVINKDCIQNIIKGYVNIGKDEVGDPITTVDKLQPFSGIENHFQFRTIINNKNNYILFTVVDTNKYPMIQVFFKGNIPIFRDLVSIVSEDNNGNQTALNIEDFLHTSIITLPLIKDYINQSFKKCPLDKVDNQYNTVLQFNQAKYTDYTYTEVALSINYVT